MGNRLEIFFHVRPPLELIDLLDSVHQIKPLPAVIHVWLHRWQTIRTDTPMPLIADADALALYDLLKPPVELIGWLDKVRQARGLHIDVAAYLRQWSQAGEVEQLTGEIKLAA